jgi:TIR domain
MNRKVFISFSYNDVRFATALKSALREEDIHIDSDIPVEQADPTYIKTTIREKMKDADAVVVLLSDSAFNSHWVLFEMGLAQGLDKRVIPVLTPGTKINESISTVISNTRFLDANNKSIFQTAEELEGFLSEEDMGPPIDQIEARVEAEMKLIEASAREMVANGLELKELEREAEKLKNQDNSDLEEQKPQNK